MKLSTVFSTLSLLYRSNGQVSCPTKLQETVTITSTLIMNWENAPDESGMVCVQVESESESWIGLGISSTGGMLGAEAVIGLPNEGTVRKYSLVGQTVDDVVEMEEEAQTLMDTSIVQEGGKTTISFATSITDYVITTMIYAVGSGNDLGYHAERGSFSLDLGALHSAATSSTPSAVEKTSTSSTMTVDAAAEEILTVVPTSAAPGMPVASIASPTYSPTVADAVPTYTPTGGVWGVNFTLSPSSASEFVSTTAESTVSSASGGSGNDNQTSPSPTAVSDEITGSPSAADTTPAPSASANAMDIIVTTASPTIVKSGDGTTNPTDATTSASTDAFTSNSTSNSTDSAQIGPIASKPAHEFKPPVAEGASKEINGAMPSPYRVGFVGVAALIAIF